MKSIFRSTEDRFLYGFENRYCGIEKKYFREEIP